MNLIARVRTYLTRDIWTADLADCPRPRRVLTQILRAVFLAARGIERHKLSIWAASLTYITLISVVPFLALVIGLGTQLGVPDKALDSLTDQLPEAQLEFLTTTLESFKKMDLKAIGIVAVCVLLWAMVKVLTRVEDAFNHVWGVERGRSLARRITNYVFVAVVAPLLLLSAMTLTASLMSSAVVKHVEDLPGGGWFLDALIGLTPYLATFVALALLYWLMPNTKVRIGSAVVGAVTAAILWQLTQRLYFHAQVGISSLGLVYGAFAALPILLLWIHVSWLIALLGAEISYGVQHAGAYASERLDATLSPASAEKTALRITVYLAHRFESGEGAAESDEISVALGIPARLTNRLLTLLAQVKIVASLEGGGFQMAGSPRRITARDVVLALRSEGEALPVRADVPPGTVKRLDALSANAAKALDRPLAELLPADDDAPPPA
jgi:membrane protein